MIEHGQIFRGSRLTESQVAEVLERHNRSDRTGELACGPCIEANDRQLVSGCGVPTRGEIRGWPLGWDREDQPDLAYIGGEANPATHRAQHRAEHAGHSYVFCSARCREKFTADPARYIGAAHDRGAAHAAAGEVLWTCPMHPEIVRKEPGNGVRSRVSSFVEGLTLDVAGREAIGSEPPF